MHLSKTTVEEFCSQTAADVAVPGGGSVAALSGSLGASLLEMVCNMSQRKATKQGVELDENLLRAQQVAKQYRAKLLELIDVDAAAFDVVMKAFALPKGTDEEKKIRSSNIQLAYKGAVCPPLEVAQKCITLLRLAISVVEKGDQNALSDALVAVRMLSSALWGAVYNVKINLSSIKDEEYVGNHLQLVAKLTNEADALTAHITANKL